MKSKLGFLLLLPLLGGCVSSVPNTFQIMAGIKEPEYYPVTRTEWGMPWSDGQELEAFVFVVPFDCALNAAVETATLPLTALWKTFSPAPEASSLVLTDPTNGIHTAEFKSKMAMFSCYRPLPARFATVRMSITSGEVRMRESAGSGDPVELIVRPASIEQTQRGRRISFTRRPVGTPVEFVIEPPNDPLGMPLVYFPIELLRLRPYADGDLRFAAHLATPDTERPRTRVHTMDSYLDEPKTISFCFYDHWSWSHGSVGRLRFETKDVKGRIEVFPGGGGR